MRWEPKPYSMSGWEFQFDDDTVKALPQTDVLQKKISDAAEHLSREIAIAENTMMLMSLTDDTLERLARLCKNELKKRKDARKNFKI